VSAVVTAWKVVTSMWGSTSVSNNCRLAQAIFGSMPPKRGAQN
jgi:hypothetical protein